MSERASELMARVEQALYLGDQRTAGILLHKILLQDFTNHQAWLQLHAMRGGKQSLEDFQQSFAQRYYPTLAHLLAQTPESEPAPQEAESRPAAIAPAVPAREQFCPVCGAAILPKAKFCSFCGERVSQDNKPAVVAAMPGPLPVEIKHSPAEPEIQLIASEATEPESLTTASEWQPIEFESLSAETKAPSESEQRLVESELQELESLINKPEPHPAEVKPLSMELDRLLKQSTSPPRGTGSLDPNRVPLKRKPYCPTCRKLFEPEDLFCDVCYAPLFQMVDKIPEEPADVPKPAAPANTVYDLPSASPPFAEPEMTASSPPEPAIETTADTPAKLAAETEAISSAEVELAPKKATSQKSAPQLGKYISSLPPFVKGMLLGLALIIAGICIGVIAYVGYQMWLG
jgi:hypothetical protein